MFVCRMNDSDETHELPIDDIRAVVIAARGVSMSPDLMSSLLETNAVILHCNHSYQPIGISSSFERVINREILYNQANYGLQLHSRLWNRILQAKVANQAAVLDHYGRDAVFLKREMNNKTVDESTSARYYWKEFFLIFGLDGVQRRGEDEQNINAKLNYGYAVLNALIHRSIIAHGLSPVLGIHHITRYKAHAMVYDLMEPWRPYVDKMLCTFERTTQDDDETIRSWARHVAQNLKDTSLKINGKQYKMMDAIDMYVSRIAQCYEHKSIRTAWMPFL